MTSTPTVISINTSPGGIPKSPLESVAITPAGLAGDGHDHDKHNTPLQAVSILDLEDIDDLRAEGFDVYPGATGENVTVQHLNVDELNIGDRLRFAGGVELELTKKRKPCFVLDSISPELKNVFGGRCGFLAKVLIPGELTSGESIEVLLGEEASPADATSTSS